MKRLLGALALALLGLVTAPTLAVAEEVGDLCQGVSNCTVENGEFGPGFPGIPGWFVGLFILMLILGVGTTVYRVSTARTLARRAGLDEGDATAVPLLEENGLGAAYVASALRQPEAAGHPSPEPAPRPAAERLAELEALRTSGTITESEYAARRQAIIDSI